MKIGLVILSLFLATVCALQDNSTSVHSVPTSVHTSATSTHNIASFTIMPYSSGIPTSSVPHSSSAIPTHSPTPPPFVSACYSLNYTAKQPCVKLCVDKPIRLSANHTTGNKTQFSNVTIPDPWNVNISGSCPVPIIGSQERSALSLKWSKSGGNYQLNLTFLYNQKNIGNGKGKLAQDRWYLESATFFLNESFTYVLNVTRNDTATIVSDIRRAYTCDSPLTLELRPEPNNPDNKDVAILNMTHYTIQPFALNLTDYAFQFLDSCEPGGIPLFVPIIVAGILAGFVLVLLLLYVIGRFRLKKKGEYERLT